ncbi:MAG: ribosome maturation factor RimP [Acetanaerobacterium sp.]
MAKRKHKSTVEITTEICAPVAQRMGLTIWDIRFEKEGASWFLRIYIDKESGVTIGDCEAMSVAIDGLLDEADPIEQSYYLEVSSPGIDRELVKPWHFEQYIGSVVDVRTIRPVNGTRDFIGRLEGYEDDAARVTLLNGEHTVFLKNETAYIRLNIDEIDFGGIDEDE